MKNWPQRKMGHNEKWVTMRNGSQRKIGHNEKLMGLRVFSAVYGSTDAEALALRTLDGRGNCCIVCVFSTRIFVFKNSSTFFEVYSGK